MYYTRYNDRYSIIIVLVINCFIQNYGPFVVGYVKSITLPTELNKSRPNINFFIRIRFKI